MKSIHALAAAVFAMNAACGHQDARPLDTTQTPTLPGLEMYRQIAADTPARNLVFSPYSAVAAFSLLYPGARQESQSSLAQVFRFPLDLETFVRERRSLQRTLLTRPAGLEADDTWELQIANDIWGQKGIPVAPGYQEMLRSAFDAAFRSVDFRANPEGSRKQINDRVEEVTHDRIQDLLPAGSIRTDTRLVLTNAVYFLADWLNQFEQFQTRKESFRSDDGRTAQVDMMNQLDQFAHFDGDGYSAVALPYVGRNTEMVLMVPKTGTAAELERRLDGRLLNTTFSGLKLKRVQLSLPKFTMSSDAMDLRQPLAAMGLKSVFCGTGPVNFQAMLPSEDVCVTGAVQKAFIKVDEKGTEAAAATGIVVGTTSAPLVDAVVRVDRSSLFLIRETTSDEVLFIGRLWMPET